MTLQEAITHAKEKASEQRRRFEDIYGQEEQTEAERKEAIACLDCSNEHGLLVAWLTELQERREADRWISIKERIPAKTGRYLVTYSNGEVDACFYSYEFISGKYEVTHWRPLPKRAEESEATNETVN